MTRLAVPLLALLAVLAVVAGCSTPVPPEDVPACGGDVGGSTAAASAPDRRLLGAASEYPADGMLASHLDDLETSQRARRAAAWDAIARVVAPVPIADTVPAGAVTVPRFRTWYDSDDMKRIFGHAYESLGPTGRAARSPIPDGVMDGAFAYDQHVLDSMPSWTDEAWDAYRTRFADGQDVTSIGGLRRITMSPAATRHVAESYAQIRHCLDVGSPPAFVDGTPATTTLAHERVALDHCTSQVWGPFWVAGGRRISVWVDGTHVASSTLRVLAGAQLSTAVPRCDVRGDAGCDVAGPGAFYVSIEAGGLGLDGVVQIESTAPDEPAPGCLRGPFPLASATVAEEWRRVELGPLPTYDTSGPALAAHLAPGSDATWGEGEGMADPGPDEILTMRLAPGSTFRLAGMHIRTRELDHWLNITMWWTPHPADDFGSDRPATLTGPWAHYAMCVSIDDVERDPDPNGGAESPTLAASLAASRDGASSWCSNPYIDGAPGLVRTNCVGCHQHAFTGVRPGETIMDDARFPDHGRLFVRNNFPADQFWGLDAGDSLAVMIADTIDYWNTAP